MKTHITPRGDIPELKALLQQVGLEQGDLVEVAVEGETITIRKAQPSQPVPATLTPFAQYVGRFPQVGSREDIERFMQEQRSEDED